MLPKNKLRAAREKKLRVYAGKESLARTLTETQMLAQ